MLPGIFAAFETSSPVGLCAGKERAEELRELVEDARSKGATLLRAMAEHFNGLGIGTPRGGRWAAASVARLLRQLDRRGVTG